MAHTLSIEVDVVKLRWRTSLSHSVARLFSGEDGIQVVDRPEPHGVSGFLGMIRTCFFESGLLESAAFGTAHVAQQDMGFADLASFKHYRD
jgi:hypothetical protein